MWPRTSALALCLLVGAACGSDDASDEEAEPRRTTPIDPNDLSDIDAMSLRLEDLAAVGDIEGIASHWLDVSELEGCRLGGRELPKEKVAAFLTERLSKFRVHATDSLSKEAKGEVVFTFNKVSHAEIMNQRLRGKNCPADAHAQVFVYIRRTQLGGIIEHHFNLERVNETWRVFRYRTERVRCKNEAWEETRICKREGRIKRR